VETQPANQSWLLPMANMRQWAMVMIIAVGEWDPFINEQGSFTCKYSFQRMLMDAHEI